MIILIKVTYLEIYLDQPILWPFLSLTNPSPPPKKNIVSPLQNTILDTPVIKRYTHTQSKVWAYMIPHCRVSYYPVCITWVYSLPLWYDYPPPQKKGGFPTRTSYTHKKKMNKVGMDQLGIYEVAIGQSGNSPHLRILIYICTLRDIP